MTMKYVLFYELAADGLAKVAEQLPGHQRRMAAFHAAGTLLMAGPYGAPPVGALAIFTTREAAEEFVKEDPFVVHGVVSTYTIHDWAEALAS
jgi:uncharacterized protein